MIGIIILLLVLGVVFGVLGFAIHTLFWLAIIGIILFVGSVIWGIARRGGSRA